MFTAHISATPNMFIGSDEEDEVAATTSILIILPQTKRGDSGAKKSS
jgi:hypothetical protein